MEADLLAITENDTAETEAAMEDLLCPICLDLLHRPHRLQPCQHLFCEPCLRRLAGARIQKCPVCRSPIKDCHLDQELHDSIEDQHQDEYIQRQQAEMNSGIFNFPLPPLRRTLVEIVNEWVEESLAPDLLLLAMVILSLLIQFCIILMMKLILYQSEESPAVAIYESFRPVMRVVTIAKLILRLMAMIIQLNVQWLRRSAVPGQDRTQQL
jgi:hypothetical protein